jgi:hypothetical protein
MSPVSTPSSRLIYDALEACDLRLLSALPETWLVHVGVDNESLLSVGGFPTAT